MELSSAGRFDTYALAYEGQDRDGFISTFTISSDGTSIVRENTLEHDTNAASFNSSAGRFRYDVWLIQVGMKTVSSPRLQLMCGVITIFKHNLKIII